jgi:hypothetical protein
MYHYFEALNTLCTYSASAENGLDEQGHVKTENKLLIRDIFCLKNRRYKNG